MPGIPDERKGEQKEEREHRETDRSRDGKKHGLMKIRPLEIERKRDLTVNLINTRTEKKANWASNKADC